MRIALDQSPVSRSFPLGVQRVVRSACAALERRDDLEVVKVVPPGGASLLRWRQTQLVSEVRGQADILHSWTSAFPLRASMPVTQTVHEAPWCHGATENAGIAHRLWPRLGRWRASLVFTPSPRVAEDLGSHSKLRVIPWGVDKHFTPVADESDGLLRRELPQLPDTPFVLCLGGTRPKKRLDLVLEGALALGSTESQSIPVVCTGPATPESHALELQYPQLFCLGVVADELLPALLRAASCACILSTSEGFGLPALEALATGTPPLVAQDSVQANTAAGYGIEVEPADAASVAAGILTALGESVTSTRQTGGLAHAATRTWDRTAEQLVQEWRSLL